MMVRRFWLGLALLLPLPMMNCATTPAGELTGIDQAKAVIRSHEMFVRTGDLDGIMSNAAEDIVVLAANAPLVQGKAALREFYAGLLKMGTFDLGHDYEGAEVVGDTVVLHGVARGTLTPATGQPSRFANNFILTFRKYPDGKFRFWRIAFAPSAEV